MRHAILVVCATALLASCGGDSDVQGVTTDGGNGSGDAGAIGCSLSLVPPADTGVGQAVEVTAIVQGSVFGIQEFSWSVDLDDVTQTITELADPADRIAFTPFEAGPYRVVVNATVGGESCLPATTTIGVVATGARLSSYRMRVVPANGAPVQDIPVDIYGGSNAVLPVSVLAAGDAVNGTILSSTGEGVPAYVRARLRNADAPTDFEAFSSATGTFSLQLPDGRFDVLIVPQTGSLPSTLLPDITIEELATTISLAAPVPISGRLLDAGGGGVSGARVSLVVGVSRSSEVTTAADGTFSVLAAVGGLTGLAVAPPPGSGMPSLRAGALSGQAVSESSNVVIQYADPSINAQVDIEDSSGGVAAGASVEWRASLANAGTVDVGSVESIDGTLRVLATSDVAGRVETSLVARDSSLVVISGDGGEARLMRDVPWATAPISTLALQTLLATSALATAQDDPLEGAEVRAIPQGVLAPQFATVSATTSADGAVALGLVPGGAYHIEVLHPVAGASGQLVVDAQPATIVGPLDLPGTITAQGQVKIDTEPAPGAQVRLFCDVCTGHDATRVHASAVADATGRFMFRISDPGVEPQ